MAIAAIACGGSTATPSPTQEQITARHAAAVPGDFAPTVVTACAPQLVLTPTSRQTRPRLVPHPTSTGSATGFGPDSALTDSGDSHRLAWLRGQAVSFMLVEDVDSWQTAAKAVDARLIR